MSETTATAPPSAGTEGGSPAQSPTPAAAPTKTSTQGTATTPEPALTTSVLTADPAAPAAPETPAAPAEPTPITPTEFTEFALPDGVDKDAPALATFRDEASKLGLSQEAAQTILSKVGEQIAAQGRAQAEAWQGLNQTWQAEIKADPEFGGSKLPATVANIARVFDDFVGNANSPERKALNEALLLTGAGNNPTMFRLLARVANTLTEGTHVTGSPARAAFNPADMFPKSAPPGAQ